MPNLGTSISIHNIEKIIVETERILPEVGTKIRRVRFHCKNEDIVTVTAFNNVSIELEQTT